jgi:CRP/FNR family cyclic AMP-dependent transcriptional regulator
MQVLGTAMQERVIADAYDVLHKDGDMVARRGEPVRSWIGVAEGFLKAIGGAGSQRPVLYSSIPAGSWIGEGSVIKDEPRHYDLVAVGNTRTVHIPRATFRWLLETSFEFNHFVISHLSERLAQFMAMVETDRIEDPKVRVARALCGLFNPVIYPQMGSVLRISQQEIGELAGISRQRANAAVSELKKKGVLQGQYGAIIVLDLAALKAIANSEPAE